MKHVRLKQQIDFIREIDKIKQIFRQTKLFDGDRFENDAEHSWHLAMMAMVLSEHSNRAIDISKVIKMVLIHDIVEIDAGDVFVYDVSPEKKNAEETKAAQRIFGILPDDQKNDLIQLWEEFEQQESPEACFAAAMDRLEPVMQNYFNEGYAWKKHGIKYSQVIAVNTKIRKGSEALWEFAKSIIDECRDRGWLIT